MTLVFPGLILSQVVFLAYMVVLKKTANVVVSAILVVFTACVKMLYVVLPSLDAA